MVPSLIPPHDAAPIRPGDDPVRVSESPSSAAPPLLSVVVATRNRAASLAACLRSVAASAARLAGPSEVIVVDNGSSDGTAAVIAAAAGAMTVVPLIQPTPGLARARNTGLRHARAPLVAFTDDDCRVEPDWMSAIVRRLTAADDIDGLGGRVALDDPADAPVSIRLAAEPRRVTDIDTALDLLIGCNFALRRAVIDRLGGFDERLGAGTPASSAEDLDLWHRMLAAGSALFYDPAVAVRHAHGRRDPKAVATLRHGYVVGRGAFLAKHGLRGDRAAWRWLIRELRRRDLRRDLLQGFWLRLSGR